MDVTNSLQSSTAAVREIVVSIWSSLSYDCHSWTWVVSGGGLPVRVVERSVCGLSFPASCCCCCCCCRMTSVMTSTQSDGVDAVAASRRGVDSHPNTDDQRLDAALVHSTSDAKVAVLAPLRAPRVGAQLCIHYQTTNTHTRKHNRIKTQPSRCCM